MDLGRTHAPVLILVMVSIGVCALRSVTETNQSRSKMRVRLLEDNGLDTGEEQVLPINALPQLTNAIP